jgi:hypothetical protein
MARSDRRAADHRVRDGRDVQRQQSSDTLRSLQGLATIPEFLWELFLGLYCTFKGFRPSSPILRADTHQDRPGAAPAVAPA